ncbi:hypothetical protein ACJJI4_01685 [Microbulbifer sp. TRSA002]|uniref:hypothetical protein n=1 Tax=Microbulbifer sp. TRSA002 TaxID=3243382 RepID=UPI004039CE91
MFVLLIVVIIIALLTFHLVALVRALFGLDKKKKKKRIRIGLSDDKDALEYSEAYYSGDGD